MMGIITMQIVSTEHLIALSPWSIKRYDRKVSAEKIVDCLFVDRTCCGYFKDGRCKRDNWPLLRCLKMNLNHSDEKCLVLWGFDKSVISRWFIFSNFHILCKQTFDKSSVHNMYVKRAQRGRGRSLQHFSSCGCWADPKTLSDAQPSTNFTTPCALCRRTWTSWGKKPTLSLFEYPAKPLKG